MGLGCTVRVNMRKGGGDWGGAIYMHHCDVLALLLLISSRERKGERERPSKVCS